MMVVGRGGDEGQRSSGAGDWREEEGVLVTDGGGGGRQRQLISLTTGLLLAQQQRRVENDRTLQQPRGRVLLIQAPLRSSSSCSSTGVLPRHPARSLLSRVLPLSSHVLKEVGERGDS